MTFSAALPEQCVRDLEAAKIRQAAKNAQNDRWVEIELSANIDVTGCEPYRDGWYLTKAVGDHRAHLRVRIPVWVGRLLCGRG